MFNLKSMSSKYQLDHIDQADRLDNNRQIMKSLKSGPLAYRPKKFAIFGTKISDSINGSGEFLTGESAENLDKILEEQSPTATEILGRILQKNLNTYNHLINYNYKTKIKKHEEELKSNRLNFLLGMRQNEKVFSVRPASLNDLNERLGKIYSLKTLENSTRDSSSQTKIIYDLSKKQTTPQSASKVRSNIERDITSASVESFKERMNSIPEVLKKLALVDFSEHDNKN